MSNKDLEIIKSALSELLNAQREIMNGFDFTSNVSFSVVSMLHESASNAIEQINLP